MAKNETFENEYKSDEKEFKQAGDVNQKPFDGEKERIGEFDELFLGYGDSLLMRADRRGIWWGANDFDSAPLRIGMDGTAFGFGTGSVHNDLSGLQGGSVSERYHLTLSQYNALTGGGDTSLHHHDNRYYTETEIGNTGIPSGASLVGYNNSSSTLYSSNVQDILDELDNKFVDQKEPNGFLQTTDSLPPSTSQISFVDGTRTFTIQPTDIKFSFYHTGKKFTKTAADNIVISDVEGMHYIYYNSSGVLSETTSSTSFETTIIPSECLVAAIYWDATNNKGLFLEERHMNQMAGQTHVLNHLTRGSQFISGSAISNIDTDQDGSLDSHAQFGVDAGEMRDEDIRNQAIGVVSTTGTTILYKSGSGGDWRWTTNSGFNVLTAGTGRLAWNEFTGGTWQLSEASDNSFVLCHIIHTNEVNKRQFAIVGQNEYANIVAAREGANTEVGNLITTGLPFTEFVFIATVIFQTRDLYTNSLNARTRTTDTGADFIDWRTSKLSPATISVVSHLLLADLNGGDGVGNHTNAFNLLGRSGGQIAIGGTATSEKLRLQDNSVDGNYIEIGSELDLNGLNITNVGTIGTGAFILTIDETAFLSDYLLEDGTRPLTGNWDAGAFKITAEQFESDVSTGTPPFIVASSTLVANLNADLLDGEEGNYYLDSANFTGTRATNWDTAYTHSQDNSQAHSDYLINNGDDSTTGKLTATGFILGDNQKIQLGTGLDGEIFVDNNDNLYIRNITDDKDIYIQIESSTLGTKTPIFISGSSCRIGIGTTTPSYCLDFACSGSDILLGVSGSTTAQAVFQFPRTFYIEIAAGTTPQVIDLQPAFDPQASGVSCRNLNNNIVIGGTSSYGINTGIGVFARCAFVDSYGGTVNNLSLFRAADVQQLSSGSPAIGKYIGFEAVDLTFGTENYGFRGRLTSGTGKFNLYIDGSADNYIEGDLGIGIVPSDLKLEVNGKVGFTPSTTQNITAGGGINITNTIMRVQGSGGAVVITATPNIADGTDGQIVIIQGDSDTNTLTLQDESSLANSGLQLSGGVDMTLGKGDTIMLTYDSGDDKWYEISRSNN